MNVMNSLSLQKIESDEVYELLSQEVSLQLVNLWDKCLIHQYELESDEVYELLSQEVSQNNRIRKKRPTPFFQSSFQLLEEENEENLVDPI
ncbi:hypothetical protein Glove_275g46 [Diversispora epigaea]|uniref:Uncharacterized protein n=1 Tax=Diversispora epigaea TaxID=1348612 RepID=A0A397I9Q1_9GLOM|nr:hypothetical protein Glove_275g46 [Diversispora epigaea]